MSETTPTDDNEIILPKSQILHLMILFANEESERFTGFVNKWLEDGEEPIPHDEMRYAIGVVHGAYDAMEVASKRESSIIAGLLKRTFATGDAPEPDDPNLNVGQYL